MDGKKIGKAASKIAIRILWPWPAIRKNLSFIKKAKQQHKENIVYIKDMASRAVDLKSDAPIEYEDGQSFEDMMRSRSPGAPTLATLEKRFLRQKRLAMGTCGAFILMGTIAIVNGNWLGIATLLSSLPLFFMACLSAQLRLWQMRTKRLSKAERGGLIDFIREINGWYWQVLDPELGKKTGEKS
jgi:hypothetical protein